MEKQFYGKTSFYQKNFYQTILTCLKYDTCLYFMFLQVPKSYPKPKTKIQVFWSWKFCFFRTYSDRSTGPVDRCAQKLCMCISVDRPGRPMHLCVLGIFRSTDPVDRTAPTVTFLTVGGRPTRSTGLCQKF